MTYNRVTSAKGKGQFIKSDEIRKLTQWAQDNRTLLWACDPDMPGPYNRKADTWRLLYAMAELTGGKWLDKVTDVVTLLADKGGENESPGVLLLADIRRIFKQVKHDDLPSNHLVEHLAAMPERPWSDFKYGKPITPRQIADLLRPFGIGPSTQRYGNYTFKGYKRSQFKKAFSRYVKSSSVTGSQTISRRQLSNSSGGNKNRSGTARKHAKSAKRNACDRVTGQVGGENHTMQTKAAVEILSYCPECYDWGCEKCEDIGSPI
jgi:hypothetical protein